MDQTDKNAQGRKPKIYVPAILSPLIALFCIWIAFAWIVFNDEVFGFLVLQVVGLLLGIITCWKIHKSKGALRGYIFSISGAVLAVIIIILILLPRLSSPPIHRPPSAGSICTSNLYGLGKAIHLYSWENDVDGRYPTPDKWCDLLVEYVDIDEKQYVCKGALKTGDKGRCHYAINPNCARNSQNDVVLLFETTGGWNQYGGPELLNNEHHEGEGSNVLFNNGRVRFIKTEQLSELKWGNKPKDGAQTVKPD